MRPVLRILVFARAPVAGQAKTRLAPRLGAWGAARLQARLTLHALRTALASGCGPVELHVTARHRVFLHYANTLGIRVRMQQGRDLGERMHRSLRRARAAILIGTDCPELRPADLRRAARLLQAGNEVVLAPAEDGGYVLIAARHVSARLFEAMEWGSAGVYASTIRRLAELGCRWRALRRMRDLDRPQDLEELRWLRWPAASRQRARR